jgi:hypothetical protein
MLQTTGDPCGTLRQTKPICHFWLHCSRLGGGCPRYEMRDSRYARAMSAPRQTNPISVFWGRERGCAKKTKPTVSGRLPSRRAGTALLAMTGRGRSWGGAGAGCDRAGRAFLLDYRGRIGDARRFPQHLGACSVRRQAC